MAEATICWETISGVRHSPLCIVDGAMQKKAIAIAFEHFRRLPYKQTAYADAASREHLHFFHHFPAADWPTHPVLSHFIDTVSDVLGDVRPIFSGVGRMYANLVNFGEVQHVHTDPCRWTAIAMLNDHWEDDWGGEFFLYANGLDRPALAVPVIPGRIVIFNGKLLHRAGVPSRSCSKPRVTLVLQSRR